MDIIDTMHKTVHNPRHGGSVGLAARLGMSDKVLNSKVNPNIDSHHLRLDEALTIMTLTGDHSGMEAMAAQLGGVYIQLPDVDSDDTDALIQLLLDTTSKHGQVCETIGDALSDGNVDCKEAQASINKLDKLIASAQKLKLKLKEKL